MCDAASRKVRLSRLSLDAHRSVKELVFRGVVLALVIGCNALDVFADENVGKEHTTMGQHAVFIAKHGLEAPMLSGVQTSAAPPHLGEGLAWSTCDKHVSLLWARQSASWSARAKAFVPQASEPQSSLGRNNCIRALCYATRYDNVLAIYDKYTVGGARIAWNAEGQCRCVCQGPNERHVINKQYLGRTGCKLTGYTACGTQAD